MLYYSKIVNNNNMKSGWDSKQYTKNRSKNTSMVNAKKKNTQKKNSPKKTSVSWPLHRKNVNFAHFPRNIPLL